MKQSYSIIVIIFLCVINLNAQVFKSNSEYTNPDGIYPSISFSNFYYDIDKTETKNIFNFAIETKIPLTSYLTFVTFYEKNNYEVSPILKTNYYKYGFKINFYLGNW